MLLKKWRSRGRLSKYVFLETVCRKFRLSNCYFFVRVIDRDGNAINITMLPNDMVFYESHSLIHGVSNFLVIMVRV